MPRLAEAVLLEGEYVGPTKVLTTNVGVIAWSAGGSLARSTRKLHDLIQFDVYDIHNPSNVRR